MLRIALTGNVASGKSVVADVWRAEGIPVIGADELSRRAVEPGSPTLEEIVSVFGSSVLTAEGGLDRAAMRELVFRDHEARRRLEDILHPRIEELRRTWAARREREGAALAAFEIPLLFELGMRDAFDVVVVVDAPAAERERRLVDDRGLDPEAARRIMESQGDPAEKRIGADHVIENDSDLVTLRESAGAVLDRIREDAEAAA